MQNTKENYSVGLIDPLVYLKERGKEQSREAGEFLKGYIEENNIDLSNSVMWVSPFTRTRETADIINQYLGIEKVKEDFTLVEQQYGLFSDKDIETIRKLFPEQFAYYDQYYQNGERFYPKLPQGESPFSKNCI